MPLSAKSLALTPREAKLTWAGETLTIHYNQDGLTNREWRELRTQFGENGNAPPDTDWVIEFLSRMLKGWDLLEDGAKSKPYPITKESLDALPPRFLAAVVEAILEDARPNPAPATASGSFS